MQDRARDDDVVLAGGILGVDAERIVDAHVPHGAVPELVVGAGQPEAPMPLLADGLDGRGVLGHLDEIRPDEQARRQHRRDADRRERRQRDLELGALGLVMRLVAGPGAEPPDAVGGEQVDGDEHDAADPERDVDRQVDRVPVGGERCEVPAERRAREMKNQRAYDEQDDDDGESHHTKTPPKTLGARSAVAVLMCRRTARPAVAGAYSTISFPFINTKWPGNEQKYV